MSKRRTAKRRPPARRRPSARVRHAVLALLKQHGGAGIAEVAAHLRISYEGARLHVAQLEQEGLVERRTARGNRAVGRPLARYVPSHAGEHLFPKSYDELAIGLIDALTERLGAEALKQVLTAYTDKRVRDWAARLEGKPLAERVAALQDIYGGADPYMSVEISRGGLRLIERNCPFLNVASRRPALCSVTVSALQRLLGVNVVREERFQTGHGRCVFQVRPNEPIDARRLRFALEPGPVAATS